MNSQFFLFFKKHVIKCSWSMCCRILCKIIIELLSLCFLLGLSQVREHLQQYVLDLGSTYCWRCFLRQALLHRFGFQLSWVGEPAPPITGASLPLWLVDCHRLRLDCQIRMTDSRTNLVELRHSSRFPRRLILPCQEEERAIGFRDVGGIPFSLMNGERSLRCPALFNIMHIRK